MATNNTNTRISIVQNSLKTVIIFRLPYIMELISSGAEVTVIAPNDCQECLEKLQKIGVKVAKIPPFSTFVSKLLCLIMLNLNVIKSRLSGHQIVCHFLVTFLFCYLTLVPFNRKLIISIEGLGTILNNKKIYRRAIKFLLTKSLATRLFTNKYERMVLGLPKDIVTGGIGVDLEKFYPHNSRIESSTDKIFNILFVGRLLEDKGIQDLIDAFRLTVALRNDIKLTVVGDIYPNNPTSLNQETINNIEKEFCGLIEFVGFRENVVPYYQEAHVLVLPSKHEGFPVCVMEANAMGIPVIVYDVPGCIDAVEDGLNGLIIDCGNIKALAHAINFILDHRHLKTMNSNSRNYALEHFCCIKKTNDFLKLL